ncbi:hypothetical protein [Planctomicrobium sp. SH527]|uniref:hypothetical protein n=1 Tax=Planctomicrobium sp. SH527 TaxID=3448123 RepID=UPI003F5B2CBD
MLLPKMSTFSKVALLTGLLFVFLGALVSVKSYLFYKKIESCFDGHDDYIVTFNSRMSGLRKVNISIHPSFLINTTVGRFLGGVIGSVEQIWLISPSLESQRLVSSFSTLDGIGIRGNTEVDFNSCERIGNMPLKILHLTSSGINDRQFRSLTKGGEIEDLVLSDERNLTANGFSAISKLRGLRWVTLTELPNVTSPEWISLVSDLNVVEYLHVSGLTFGDDSIRHIPTLGTLSTVILFDTNVTDRGVEALVGHRGLKTIAFRNGKMSFSGIKLLSNLPDLGELAISGVPLSPQEIDELRRLIPNCKITIYNGE